VPGTARVSRAEHRAVPGHPKGRRTICWSRAPAEISTAFRERGNRRSFFRLPVPGLCVPHRRSRFLASYLCRMGMAHHGSETEYISRVAEALNVSVDFLLGHENGGYRLGERMLPGRRLCRARLARWTLKSSAQCVTLRQLQRGPRFET